MRAAIFIDAGYLIKQLHEQRITPDYSKLSDYLLKPLRASIQLDLLRCYFYYCPPYLSPNQPRMSCVAWPVTWSLLSKLKAIDRWQFRVGKLEKRREGDKDVFSQKRVDVLLSVDLVRHCAAGHIQHAVLVAGDSDFIPAVKAAKESGTTLTLWCADDRSPHKDLVKESDEVQIFKWRHFPRQRGKSKNSNSNPVRPQTRSDNARNGNSSSASSPTSSGGMSIVKGATNAKPAASVSEEDSSVSEKPRSSSGRSRRRGRSRKPDGNS